MVTEHTSTRKNSSWESGGRRVVRCGRIVKGFLQTYAQGHALVTSGIDANRRSDLSSTVSKVIYRYTELYGIFIVLYRLPACQFSQFTCRDLDDRFVKIA
ncbi:hypothetical protein J6590_078571 [Homalodisca vitripennis]|nr:hypothetical protein J6590_078571 [Homalodisca vitripennis]